ncbi:MAG: hypothetical protein WDO73_36780 [Ignavibacteriota bacterium]
MSTATQTITFTGLPANAAYGSAGPYTLNGTASSGLPVSYAVTGPATINGSTLTITGVGTVSVTASQAGNANYAAATPVSLTIKVSTATQTIAFTGLPANATYGSAGPYTLNGTASSGLPVSYSVTGPATLSGATLTITGIGTVTVTASQAGNANYAAANPVAQTITVSAGTQTITFAALPTSVIYGAPELLETQRHCVLRSSGELLCHRSGDPLRLHPDDHRHGYDHRDGVPGRRRYLRPCHSGLSDHRGNPIFCVDDSSRAAAGNGLPGRLMAASFVERRWFPAV